MTNLLTDREWLLALVIKDANGCWLWTKGLNHGGYGFAKRNRIQFLVHRRAYQLFVGPIPKGLFVLHKCDVRRCCNPDHLFIGTQADNNADMRAKGRQHKPIGEANPRAKLKRDDVISIRSMLREGKSPRKIAQNFGVSKETIWAIKYGRVWAESSIGGPTYRGPR